MPAVALDGGLRVFYANKAMARLLGRRASELVGCEWTDLAPAQQVDNARAALECALSGTTTRARLAAERPDGIVVALTVSVQRVGEGLFIEVSMATSSRE